MYHIYRLLGIENELILQLKRTIDLVEEPPRKQQSVASDEASTPSGAAPSGIPLGGAEAEAEATAPCSESARSQPAAPRTPGASSSASGGAGAGAQVEAMGAAASSPNDQPLQIARLKQIVQQKREQMGTLRAVLRANKQTAEQAHASLKHKYESERSAVTETMNKLRAELRTLKEEAATFVTLRTLFSERIEQMRTDCEDASRKLQVG